MMKFVKYDIKKIEILLMLLFVAFQSRAYDFEKDGIYYNFNGTEITCKAAVPPVCDADCFSGVEQRDCKLYVPEGSVEAYRNAPVWQNFDIIATDFSGIEEISAEGSVRIYASGGSIVLENLSPGMPVAVYDTTGHKVKTVEATGSRMEVVLPAGFYVVECAGKVEKVMLRALSGRI